MLMLNVHPASRLFQSGEVGHVCRCRDDISPRIKHSGCAWKFMVSAGKITANVIHSLDREKIFRLNVLLFFLPSSIALITLLIRYPHSILNIKILPGFRKDKPVTPGIWIWVLMFLGNEVP